MMKKIFIIILAICLLSSGLVMPVYAQEEQIVYVTSLENIDWELLGNGDKVFVHRNIYLLSEEEISNVAICYIKADSMDNVNWDEYNIGDCIVIPCSNGGIENEGGVSDAVLSEENDGGMISSSRDINKPGYGSEWNVMTQGIYDFSGKCSPGTIGLYTDVYFIGATAYGINVENNRSEDLTVTCMKGLISGTDLYSFVAPGDTTVYTSISSNNCSSSITTNTKWYIHFSAPALFSGYVRGFIFE